MLGRRIRPTVPAAATGVLAVLLVAAAPAHAGAPQLLKDINTQPWVVRSPCNFGEAAVVGSTLFFSSCDHPGNTELWKSDGTAGSARRVKDIRPGVYDGSNPHSLRDVNGTLFFVANDGPHGDELWTSDGTTGGTTLVKDIAPGAKGSRPQALTEVGGRLFFVADDGVHGSELWTSDGTAAGTVLLKDIMPGAGASLPEPYVTTPSIYLGVNGVLFFTADDGSHGVELWRSDGTAAGTTLVKDIQPGANGSSPEATVRVGGTVFFSADDGSHGVELWKSDGTEAGTVLVKDIRPGAADSRAWPLLQANGILYFAADDGVHGNELWRSDGTVAGTLLVKDVTPGTSGPWDLYAYSENAGGTIFFSADDGVHGTELWASDGTAAGTRLVKDICPGENATTGAPCASEPEFFREVNGTLFFVAQDGVHGYELWKSDGTERGTVLVKDIWPGTSGPWDWYSYMELLGVGGRLFFFADDGVHGEELWTSDGTGAGTAMVKDFAPGSAGSLPQWAGVVNGTPFLWAYELRGAQLWKTNGTAAGTVKLLPPATATADAVFGELVGLGGRLVFPADDGSKNQLWTSDGTPPGTRLLKDVPAQGLTAFGSGLSFQGEDAAHGRELWRSDGTPVGTALLKDIRPGLQGSDPHLFVTVGKTLFFFADDGTHGMELWKSDGTSAGTVLVKDIAPGAASSPPPADLTSNEAAVAANGKLFFVAGDGTPTPEGYHAWRLWKSDGTAAGTLPVPDSLFASALVVAGRGIFFERFDYELCWTDGTSTVLLRTAGSHHGYPNLGEMVAVGNTLFFSLWDWDHGRELWKSDGTPAGTVMVKDLLPGTYPGFEEPLGSEPYALAAHDGKLYFAAYTDFNATEIGLFRSDGTAAGTVLVRNRLWITSPITSANGALYFAAIGDAAGDEPWTSDGTAAGTMRVADLWPGPNGSLFWWITHSGSSLFFSAEDGVHGRELWAMGVAPAAPRAYLSMTISDGLSEAIAGQALSYVIRAANLGPAAVVAARVTDVFPAALLGVSWSCSTSAGSSCELAHGTGAIDTTVSLLAGGRATFLATAQLDPLARGLLVNTATVFSDATVDPDLSDNAAADADLIVLPADVRITKTDGRSTASPGQAISYTITVANLGATALTGVSVSDPGPAELTSPTWSCAPSAGASCTGTDTGEITDTVALPVGGSVVYTLSGTVSANPASLSNTATASLPLGYGDTNPLDNTATDTDVLVCGNETPLVGDGRTTAVPLASGATQWFLLSSLPGRSYSVEVQSRRETAGAISAMLFRGDDGCAGTTTATWNETNDADPARSDGVRFSYTASGSDAGYRLRVTNDSGRDDACDVSVVETTGFSAAWSTNGSYDTFYSLQNTTGTAIRMLLTLDDIDGTETGSVSFTIPAGITVSTNTAAIGATRNRTGAARLTHDGPPGALVTEAAIANFGFSPPYVQPVKVEAVRGRR